MNSNLFPKLIWNIKDIGIHNAGLDNTLLLFQVEGMRITSQFPHVNYTTQKQDKSLSYLVSTLQGILMLHVLLLIIFMFFAVLILMAIQEP